MSNLSERTRRLIRTTKRIRTTALPNLTEEQQVEALYFMLTYSTQRDFLRRCLSDLNIPHRTRIYQAFGTSWSRPTNTEEDKLECAKEILKHSNIHQWFAALIMNYPLHSFLAIIEEIYTPRNIEFTGTPLIIIDNGQNT